ncbi:MAG: hypothetical protein JNM84_24375 [Planctomycetes bacterium]|nr:hypothetical protein [Planctomycetota bacterium]
MFRTLSALLSTVLVAALVGCQSSPKAPSPSAQALVESLAAENKDVVRLTVHQKRADGSGYHAVASTAPAKLGQASDPEDLRAIEKNEVVVLEENGALDVTVPICDCGDGKPCAATGVTLKAEPGADRAALEARAKQIAQAVEAGLSKEKS